MISARFTSFAMVFSETLDPFLGLLTGFNPD
jgi:hypothetical protein